MACFFPLQGWRAKRADPKTRKRRVVFDRRDGFSDMPVTVPCGKCDGCRLSRSRQWAIRCMHEAALYERNCFITLTYADEYLPEGASLVKQDFQKFMKRLRKRCPVPKPGIRYFMAGEYGEQFKRPHYHALLFNFDFPDKQIAQVRHGFPVWESTMLRELWPWGRSEIGSVTAQSAAYVARYVFKKAGADEVRLSVDGDTGEVWERAPEYSAQSRRPGIAKAWYEKFGEEVAQHDSVLFGGQLVKPPRYYDDQFESQHPMKMRVIKSKRAAMVKPEEQTTGRVLARLECLRAKLSMAKRGLE